MTFEQTRRDLIAFRTANAGSPALSHRASTAVSILERLQEPAGDAHAARLRMTLKQTMQEIAAVKANGGIYVPSKSGDAMSSNDRGGARD